MPKISYISTEKTRFSITYYIKNVHTYYNFAYTMQKLKTFDSSKISNNLILKCRLTSNLFKCLTIFYYPHNYKACKYIFCTFCYFLYMKLVLVAQEKTNKYIILQQYLLVTQKTSNKIIFVLQIFVFVQIV